MTGSVVAPLLAKRLWMFNISWITNQNYPLGLRQERARVLWSQQLRNRTSKMFLPLKMHAPDNISQPNQKKDSINLKTTNHCSFTNVYHSNRWFHWSPISYHKTSILAPRENQGTHADKLDSLHAHIHTKIQNRWAQEKMADIIAIAVYHNNSCFLDINQN